MHAWMNDEALFSYLHEHMYIREYIKYSFLYNLHSAYTVLYSFIFAMQSPSCVHM